MCYCNLVTRGRLGTPACGVKTVSYGDIFYVSKSISVWITILVVHESPNKSAYLCDRFAIFNGIVLVDVVNAITKKRVPLVVSMDSFYITKINDYNCFDIIAIFCLL